MLLIILGVLLVFFFGLVYDTTVPVYEFAPTHSPRIHNLGLMQNRLIGVVVGVLLIVVGVILTVAGRGRR